MSLSENLNANLSFSVDDDFKVLLLLISLKYQNKKLNYKVILLKLKTERKVTLN